jgi:hypothetical protein
MSLQYEISDFFSGTTGICEFQRNFKPSQRKKKEETNRGGIGLHLDVDWLSMNCYAAAAAN